MLKNEKKEKPEPLIAEKDFMIRQNDYLRMIKAGDDISDVPKIYMENLVTEGVLKVLK